MSGRDSGDSAAVTRSPSPDLPGAQLHDLPVFAGLPHELIERLMERSISRSMSSWGSPAKTGRSCNCAPGRSGDGDRVTAAESPLSRPDMATDQHHSHSPFRFVLQTCLKAKRQTARRRGFTLPLRGAVGAAV